MSKKNIADVITSLKELVYDTNLNVFENIVSHSGLGFEEQIREVLFDKKDCKVKAINGLVTLLLEEMLLELFTEDSCEIKKKSKNRNKNSSKIMAQGQPQGQPHLTKKKGTMCLNMHKVNSIDSVLQRKTSPISDYNVNISDFNKMYLKSILTKRFDPKYVQFLKDLFKVQRCTIEECKCMNMRLKHHKELFHDWDSSDVETKGSKERIISGFDHICRTNSACASFHQEKKKNKRYKFNYDESSSQGHIRYEDMEKVPVRIFRNRKDVNIGTNQYINNLTEIQTNFFTTEHFKNNFKGIQANYVDKFNGHKQKPTVRTNLRFEEIRRAVLDWMESAPIYNKNNEDTDVILEIFLRNLKILKQDPNCTPKMLQKVIKDFIDNLTMWFPGEKRDQGRFKQGLNDDVYERLHKLIFTDVKKCSLFPSRMSSSEQCKHYGYMPLGLGNRYTALSGKSSETISEISESPSTRRFYYHEELREDPKKKYVQHDSMMKSYYKNECDSSFDHQTIGKRIPFANDSVEISRYYKHLDAPKLESFGPDMFEDKSAIKMCSARNRYSENSRYVDSLDPRSQRTSNKPINVDSSISGKYNLKNSSEMLDNYCNDPPECSNKKLYSYPKRQSLKSELKRRNNTHNKRTHKKEYPSIPECGNYESSKPHARNQVRKKSGCYKPEFRENVASELRKTRFTSTTITDDGVTKKVSQTYIPNSCGAYIKVPIRDPSTVISVSPRSVSPPRVITPSRNISPTRNNISPTRNIPSSRFSSPTISSTVLSPSRFPSPTKTISPSQSSKNMCPSCYKAYSSRKSAKAQSISTNRGHSVSFETSSTILRKPSFDNLDSTISCRCSADKIAELVMRKYLKLFNLNKSPNGIDEEIVIQKLITRIRPVLKSSAKTRKNILKHYVFEFLETLPVTACCKNSKIIQTYKIAEDLANELNACFNARENPTVNVLSKIELDKKSKLNAKKEPSKNISLDKNSERTSLTKTMNSIGINTIDAIYKEVVAQLNNENIDRKVQTIEYISDTFLDYVEDIQLGNMEEVENEVFDVLRDIGRMNPINASKLTKQITAKMCEMITNKNNKFNHAAPTNINSDQYVYKTKSGTLIILNNTETAQSERNINTVKVIDTKSVNKAKSCINQPKSHDQIELLCAVIDSWMGTLRINIDNIEGQKHRENIVHDLAIKVDSRVKSIKKTESEVPAEDYLCYEIKTWLLNVLHISNINSLDVLNDEIFNLVKQLKEMYFSTPSFMKNNTSKMEKIKENIMNILVEDMYEEFMALQENDRKKIVRKVALKVINCKEQYTSKEDIKKYVINMFKHYIYKGNKRVIDIMYKECENLAQKLDFKQLVIQGYSIEVREIIIIAAKEWLKDQTLYTNSEKKEKITLENSIREIAIRMTQFLKDTMTEPLEKVLPEFVHLVKSDLERSILMEFVDKNDDYMKIAALKLMRCVLTVIKKYQFNIKYLRKDITVKNSNNISPAKPLVKTQSERIRLDEICKAVEQWCDNLKLNRPEQNIELLKTEILSKIMNQLVKYSAKSPAIEINKSLKESFFKLLDELKQNYDIDDEDNNLKTSFIETLSRAVAMSSGSSTGGSYIQKLEDTAASSIPKLMVIPKAKADIDLLKITMAEQFIIDNFTADEALKAKCGKTVIDQLRKCADKSVLDSGDAIQIQYCVQHNMCKIDTPISKEQLQKEINVIRLKWTVSEWFDELPLKPVVSAKDALEREQIKFAVAKKLYDAIEDKSDREAHISSESIKWIQKLPLETDDIDSNSMVKKLKDKLSFYINLENNFKVPVQSPLVYPLINKSAGTSKKSDKTYIQSKASIILERKSNTNNPIDVLYNKICKWTESIEIDTSSNEIEEIKNDLTANLVLKISNLNDDSDIFNNNDAYENSLKMVIQDTLNNIDIENKEECVNELVSAVMKSKHILEVHKDKQVYIKNLDSTVTAFTDKAKSNTGNEPMFEGLKEEIIDNFVEYNYHRNDEEGRQVFKQRVKDAAIELLLRSDVPDIDAKLQSEDIFRALEKVPLPNRDAIKDEIGEIRIKHEILRWYNEVPHASCNAIEELRRDQLMGVLAKRLNEIEANGYNSETETLMVAEITKHSNKIGIDHNSTKIFNQLVKRLRKTVRDRQTLNPQSIHDENKKSIDLSAPFKSNRSIQNSIVSHTSNESNWASISSPKKGKLQDPDDEANSRSYNRSGTQNSNCNKTNNNTEDPIDFNNDSQNNNPKQEGCKGKCAERAKRVIDLEANHNNQYDKSNNKSMQGESRGKRPEQQQDRNDFKDSSFQSMVSNKSMNRPNNRSVKGAPQGNRLQQPENLIDFKENSFQSIGSNRSMNKPNNMTSTGASQGNRSQQPKDYIDLKDNKSRGNRIQEPKDYIDLNNNNQSLRNNKSLQGETRGYRTQQPKDYIDLNDNNQSLRNNKSMLGETRGNRSQQPKQLTEYNDADNDRSNQSTNKSSNKRMQGESRGNRSKTPEAVNDFHSLDNNSGSFLPAEDFESGNWQSMGTKDVRIKQAQGQPANIEESESTYDTERILREEAKRRPRKYRDEHDSAVEWLNRTNASEASEQNWASLGQSNRAHNTTPKVPTTPNRYATSNLHDRQAGIDNWDQSHSAGSATYDVPEYEEMARQVPFCSTWGPDDFRAARQQNQGSNKAMTPFRDANESGSFGRSHPSVRMGNGSDMTENPRYHVSYPDSNVGRQSAPRGRLIRRNQNGKPDICLCNIDRFNCPLHFMNCHNP